jgi:hypothetical protein
LISSLHRFGATLVLAALFAAPLHAQDRSAGLKNSDFELRTAGQLLEICTANPKHPLYVSALAFCYGFLSGGQHYHDEVASVAPLGPIFCPDGQKTRDELVDVFVTYLRANPQHAGDRPVDVLFQSYAERWPCPKAKHAGEAK